MNDIKNLFLGLFSNQAIVDGRKKKWYWWILIIVLSVFLPWIPVLVSGYNSDYASLITSSSNQEIDKGFKTIMGEDYFSKIAFKTSADAKGKTTYSFVYNFTEADYSDTVTYADEYNGANLTKALYRGTYNDVYSSAGYVSADDVTNKSFDYYFDCVSVATDNQITQSTATTTTTTTTYEDIGRNVYLEAYYFPEVSIDADYASDYLNNFLTAVFLNKNTAGEAQNYPHSFVIMGQDFIVINVFALQSSKSSLTASLSYSGETAEAVKDVADNTTLKSYLGITDTASINDVYSGSFKDFLKSCAKPYGVRTAWTNVLVVSLVVLGGMVVAFLVLLFLNKRKTSLYQDIKVYECIEEGIHLTLAPALIGMVIGFFASSYMIVSILACILLRLMWIPNKISPVQENGADSNKPLYQARS